MKTLGKKAAKIHEGDLVAQPGIVYEFTEITGNLDASIFKTGEDFRKAFPNFVKAGGGLYLSALTSLPANAKITAGGYLDLRALTHKTEHKGGNPLAGGIAKAVVASAFHAIGYSIADRILAKIVQTRGPVSRVIVCGKTEVSFVVTDGEAHSHGKTLKEAREGLLYKIGNRDTTEFKNWTLDKVVSKRDAIRAYRVITGACEAGVRGWLERQGETPETITLQGVVDLTKGAFGADAFKNFFPQAVRS